MSGISSKGKKKATNMTLKVYVKDEQGNPIVGASVETKYDILGAPKGGASGYTDSSGLATFEESGWAMPFGVHVEIIATSGASRGTTSLNMGPFNFSGEATITLHLDVPGTIGDIGSKAASWFWSNFWGALVIAIIVVIGVVTLKYLGAFNWVKGAFNKGKETLKKISK